MIIYLSTVMIRKILYVKMVIGSRWGVVDTGHYERDINDGHQAIHQGVTRVSPEWGGVG